LAFLIPFSVVFLAARLAFLIPFCVAFFSDFAAFFTRRPAFLRDRFSLPVGTASPPLCCDAQLPPAPPCAARWRGPSHTRPCP
jgi:hypothetical protein